MITLIFIEGSSGGKEMLCAAHDPTHSILHSNTSDTGCQWADCAASSDSYGRAENLGGLIGAEVIQ
jgi:hypothetical protein